MTRVTHVAFDRSRLGFKFVARNRMSETGEKTVVVEHDIRRDKNGRLRDYAKPGRPIVREED